MRRIDFMPTPPGSGQWARASASLFTSPPLQDVIRAARRDGRGFNNYISLAHERYSDGYRTNPTLQRVSLLCTPPDDCALKAKPLRGMDAEHGRRLPIQVAVIEQIVTAPLDVFQAFAQGSGVGFVAA